MPDRKFARSLTGRLRWEPGDPHALDRLFADAQIAERTLRETLTTLQQRLAAFPQQEAVAAPETLQAHMTAAETKVEEEAWAKLRTRKHYHHAQALLAYLRRHQLTARLQAAAAAVELASSLLTPEGTERADPDALLTGEGSARAWRRRVEAFEAQLRTIRRLAGRSDGWMEERVVHRGDAVYGPYLAYRWREDDGRVYTVYLGKKDLAHGEAPATFALGQWAGYRIFDQRRPARSPEELIIQALRYLVEHDGGVSPSDRRFGGSLLDESQRQQLSVGQLRAAYRMLTRNHAALEASGNPELVLPDAQRLEEFLTKRLAERKRRIAGTIDATAVAYLVRFPYDEAQVEHIRAIKRTHGGDGWREHLGAWVIGATAGNDLFASFPEFARTPAALALHEHMQAQAQAKAEAEARAREQAERERAAWAAFRQKQLQQLDLAQPLPSGRVLFAHQREAVRWLLHNGKGILADDLGLGKTTSALVAAKAFALPILVLCPATLKDNWLDEAQLVDVPIQPLSWAKIPPPPKTEYVLIADEASYAQTWDAQRTQAMIRLARAPQCRAAYLLSGTPMKNGRPANLFPLLYALDHRLTQDKRWYERYFCAAHATPWTSWDISGAAHLDRLHREIKDILLRRRKQECLDLPEKTRVRRPVEISAAMRQMYQETLEQLRAEYQRRVQAGEILPKGELLVMLNHLRHAGSLAKTEAALALVDELQQQEQQVVVFVDFVKSAQRLVEALQTAGINTELLIGTTPQKSRIPLVKRFQSGQVQVLVATLDTGGVGLTLTAASTAILVDRAWTPDDTKQAEDRLHRIGQTNAIMAIWLAFGDIDRWIDDLLEQKAERIGQVLGEDARLSPLDRLDELAQLLFGTGGGRARQAKVTPEGPEPSAERSDV